VTRGDDPARVQLGVTRRRQRHCLVGEVGGGHERTAADRVVDGAVERGCDAVVRAL
jgi:hypothetical protein